MVLQHVVTPPGPTTLPVWGRHQLLARASPHKVQESRAAVAALSAVS